MDFFIAGCGEGFLVNKNIFLSLFMGGLFGSVNHCAGMCGPFVIAQTSNTHSCHTTVLKRVVGMSLIPYHLGRMVTYILLGIGTAFVMKPILSTALGQVMIVLLLLSAGILFLLHGFAVNTHFSFPFADSIGKFFGYFSSKVSFWHKFALGVTLGFMPCGLVFAAILAVTSLSNPFDAMIGMICFTLGTVPVLLGIGFISNTFIQKYKNIYTQCIKAIMIFNGLVLIGLSLGKLI